MGKKRGRFPKGVTGMFVSGGMFMIWSLFVGQWIGIINGYLAFAGHYGGKTFQNAMADDVFAILYILNGIFFLVGLVFLTEVKSKLLSAIPIVGNLLALAAWIWMRHEGILVGFSQVIE